MGSLCSRLDTDEEITSEWEDMKTLCGIQHRETKEGETMRG